MKSCVLYLLFSHSSRAASQPGPLGPTNGPHFYFLQASIHIGNANKEFRYPSVVLPEPFTGFFFIMLFLPQGRAQAAGLAPPREHVRSPGQLWIHRGCSTVGVGGPRVRLLPVKCVRAGATGIGTLAGQEPCDTEQ